MRRALRIAAVNGSLVLAVLVVAELVFGTWISGPDYSVLNIRRNANRYFDVSGLYAHDGLIHYTRDKHGLRGKYTTPADIDVLVLGGSTTDEIYIDDADTWVAVLGRASRRAGQPLSVINAAVDGQSTLGHLHAMELWFPNIPGLKPRYVLVYLGINDVAVMPGEIGRYDGMKSPEPLRRARQYVMNHSVLYNRFRQLRGMFAAYRADLVHGAGPVRGANWKPVSEGDAWTDGRATMARTLAPRLDAFAGRLRRLAARIKDDFGAATIYITQQRGDYKVIDGRLLARVGNDATAPSAEGYLMLDLFNRRTLAVCTEMRLTCVDLAGEITFQGGDFYDQLHTTPAGSRRIGEFVFERLHGVLR